MQPSELSAGFSLDIYNALASVEGANASVRKDDALPRFLEAAAGIFVAHGMQDRFGVALLHRHSSCERGERMVEYKERFGDSDALVTRPVSEEGRDASHDARAPIVWSLEDGAFHPLEYSTDPLAGALLRQGEISDGFLDDFAGLSRASPVGGLLGLSVVRRAFYSDAGPDDIALEYSNLIARSNVVLLTDRSRAGDQSIETAWRFQKRIDAMAKCVDIRECIKTCHASDHTGGHTGTVSHRPQQEGHVPG